jgi:hypothetical protein
MAPILGIYASQISGHLFAPSGAYDSIATVTVGAGGSSSITFSSIPSTYTHLQIRVLAQNNRASVGFDSINFTFNSVGGTSYANHSLRGDGSSAVSDASFNDASIGAPRAIGTTTGGTFGAVVIDVLDYANTSKYKTTRTLAGVDVNGTVGGLGGAVGLSSGLFKDTTAVSSIIFTPGSASTFSQYSSFALYGIKGN